MSRTVVGVFAIVELAAAAVAGIVAVPGSRWQRRSAEHKASDENFKFNCVALRLKASAGHEVHCACPKFVSPFLRPRLKAAKPTLPHKSKKLPAMLQMNFPPAREAMFPLWTLIHFPTWAFWLFPTTGFLSSPWSFPTMEFFPTKPETPAPWWERRSLARVFP